MADTEDVESKSRENILYDLSVLAEWTFKNELFVSVVLSKLCLDQGPVSIISLGNS